METFKSICKICLGWMVDYKYLIGYRKCSSCGYTEEVMVSMKELLHNKYKLEDQPKETQDNLKILLEKINKIRTTYGQVMTVTSGLRSMDDHLRIYAEKGITDTNKIPMKSKHLYGQAVDISDPHQKLQKWCLANVKKLEEVGLWCEDFSATSNWVHFQIIPPKSGKRFFIP